MSSRRNGPSAESSKRFGKPGTAAGAGYASSRTGRAGELRPTSSRASNRLPTGGSRRSHRPSNMRRSTSSRAGEPLDGGGAPIKQLIDEQGVNRTPKPLVAIVTSAALRQARGIATEESVLGSEASDALFGDRLSSAGGFSRGWFDSGAVTPQEASTSDLEYGGRLMAPRLSRERSMTALSGSSMSGSGGSKPHADAASLSSSARPTGTPPEQQGPAAAPLQLSEDDLNRPVKVLLQESDTFFLLDMPGVAVAADSAEGALVAAANSQHAAQAAARETSDKYTSSVCQTLVPLRKAREVQSGSSSTSDAACQACTWDIHDSFAALHKGTGEDAEEQLDSVLPSGAAIATAARNSGNASSSRASLTRSSTQNWGIASSFSSMSGVAGVAAGQGPRRTTITRESSINGGWGRPSTSGMAKNNHSFDGSADTAAALLAAAAAESAAQPEPWTRLEGLAEVLTVMEAAIAQNTFLPQLLLYKDIKPPPPPCLNAAAVATDDGLTASPSLSGAGGSHQLAVVPPTPTSRASICSTPGAAAGAGGGEAWSSGTHGLSTSGLGTPGGRPSMSLTGAGTSSLSGLSRRPSSQLPQDMMPAGSRQSSFMSMGSSCLMRSNRPPAGLQLLWTWSCAATDGRPITCIAWNTSNKNLLAAGYSSNPAEAAMQATEAAAPGGAAGGGPGVGQAARGSGNGSMADDVGGPGDEEAGAAAAAKNGGKVALWSMKNQFHPVWSFDTKSAVTGISFSQRNPHILGVGMHDGTVAVYDVRSRQATPLMASTAQTGKHSGPVWKVQWLDRGPEREELLVSISTDGKVKAWTTAKGLEHSTLITLKRVARRVTGVATTGGAAAGGAAAGGGTCLSAPGLPAGSGARAAAMVAALRGAVGGDRDALISRNTGGMSFDFSAQDSRIYLAGTEDGHIHKCSTSYSEQYLESYSGHIGPVYGLQWNPFNPRLFISCSGDWTIRMWQEGSQHQLLSFQSSNEEVLDVRWCPTNSTVFGAVTAGGRLELWDFAVSTLRPVVQHASTKHSLTALQFADDAPVVVAANDAGGLMMFRLVNIAADKFEPPEMQQTRLEEALRANVMKAAFSGSG